MGEFELKSVGDTGVVVAKGELGTEDASEMKQMFVDAMAGHEKVSVDLTGVTSMGVAAMQIVLSAQSSLKAKGSELGCEGEIPEAVVKESEAAGFTLGLEDTCFWRRG
jgi:anti-anti-sigma factor